jgi:Putative prokaryotic signal transducing protein
MDEVVVGEYANQVEAEMWAGLLREQGIPCRVVQTGADVGAVGLSAWVAHALRVRAEDAERARQVLAGAGADSGPDPPAGA